MTEGSSAWHLECLDSAQILVASELAPRLTTFGGFLGGGAALALRYGHRRSRDLDWFTTEPFDSLELAQDWSRDLRLGDVRTEPNTLQ